MLCIAVGQPIVLPLVYAQTVLYNIAVSTESRFPPLRLFSGGSGSKNGLRSAVVRPVSVAPTTRCDVYPGKKWHSVEYWIFC